MRLRIDLDDVLAEALLKDARKDLRYPDQQIEAILREKLGIPVTSPPENQREPVVAQEIKAQEAVHVG
jgi:hypothetical protein